MRFAAAPSCGPGGPRRSFFLGNRHVFYQELVDARSVEIDDFEAEAISAEMFSGLRNASEMCHDHAGGGAEIMVVFVWQLRDAEQLAQIVRRYAAVDEPTAVVPLHDRLLGAFDQRCRRFADDGCQEIVECDESFDVAVLVDDERERCFCVAELLE